MRFKNTLTAFVFLFLISCSSKTKTDLDDHNDTIVMDKTSSITSMEALELKSPLGKVDVLIPSYFIRMDAEMLAQKYPLKQGVVFEAYSNEEGSVNVAFEHTFNNLSPAELPVIKQVFEKQFAQPGIEIRRSEIIKINGRDFIVLEMITPAVDTDIYNQMFMTSLDGRLFIGTFNCTMAQLKEWQPVVEQIVNSVIVKN